MKEKNTNSQTFYVEGMHCAACELLIEKKISKVDGVSKVDAKLNEGTVHVQSNKDLTPEELSTLVEKDGYKILKNKNQKLQINKKDLVKAFVLSIVLFSLFLLLQKTGIINLTSSDGEITLPFVFMIGVVASLSTCMAVVGGLVLSLSSSYAKEHQTKPMIAFHIARIVSFFLLGGVMGLIGSAFVLTSTMSFVLNIILFFVMVIMGLNLLEITSFTKKLQLKMPKFIGKNVLKIEEKNHFLTPVLLGAATFFLPCGFTQSMQLYSLSTGNFIEGAITMFVYALGTFPILALISFASAKFSKTLQSGLFFKTAGFIIIFFALFNFLAALVAVGLISPIFNI